MERKLPRRAGGGASKETLTLFQFWSYLEAEGVNDLDAHIPELAEEGMFECHKKGCSHGQQYAATNRSEVVRSLHKIIFFVLLSNKVLIKLIKK